MTMREFIKEAWEIITGTEPRPELTEAEILQTKKLLERLREGESNIE